MTAGMHIINCLTAIHICSAVVLANVCDFERQGSVASRNIDNCVATHDLHLAVHCLDTTCACRGPKCISIVQTQLPCSNLGSASSDHSVLDIQRAAMCRKATVSKRTQDGKLDPRAPKRREFAVTRARSASESKDTALGYAHDRNLSSIVAYVGKRQKEMELNYSCPIIEGKRRKASASGSQSSTLGVSECLAAVDAFTARSRAGGDPRVEAQNLASSVTAALDTARLARSTGSAVAGRSASLSDQTRAVVSGALEPLASILPGSQPHGGIAEMVSTAVDEALQHAQSESERVARDTRYRRRIPTVDPTANAPPAQLPQ